MEFVIRRKVLISMLFVATTMLGFISYKQLKMEIFPNAELPMLYVQVSSRIEVTPEYMEEKAIIPIESAIAALENIELIESTANRRRGVVYITYQNRTNLKYAYLKLDERIKALQGVLPDEFTLQVIKVDTETSSNTLMSLQALGSGGTDRVRNIVDQKIVPEIENIDGVAAVNVYGGAQRSVDIILDREACEAYKITPSRVSNILSRSMNLRQYAGYVKEEGERFFIYLDAEYDQITQIENLVVGRGRNPVQLKDIATVYYGQKEQETISRVNGKDAVSFVIVNDARANIIDLSDNIRSLVRDLNRKYKSLDFEIIIQEDAGETMENNINQIINLAVTGGLLAIFFLWVFLRNIRLVTVIAIAIPISIYTAFNFFYGFGITINSLTLVGIALAVGMLLDNSVVVLENIYRLRSLGLSPAESVTRGTREVWRSIVAATLTTVAVFLPFVFSSNFYIKLMGRHIGVSIISTLTVSLIVALLLIPMIVHAIASRKRKIRHDVYQKMSLDSPGIRFYLFLLKTALRNPGPTIIGGIILFFATILTSMSVSVNRLSELETSRIQLNVTMPTGSTLEKTDELVTAVEAALDDIPEKKQIISTIEEEEARIVVDLKDDYYKINNRSYGEIEEDILNRVKNFPASDISLSSSGQQSGSPGGGGYGGGGGSNAGGASRFQKLMGIGENEEYIVLKSQDFELMVEVAEDIQSYLEELDNISRVSLSVRENQPEVHLDFHPVLMTDYDVSYSGVLNELNSFQNELSSGVTFRQGEEEYEIMIKYNDEETSENEQDKRLEDLYALDIPDADDENLHELQSFADIYYARGMREISRVNQEKQVELRYTYNDDVYESKDLLNYARQEIDEVILNANVPSGVAVETVVEDSGLNEFKWLFMLALLLIFMILASIFESLTTPFVLLFSIPLAAIGSFFLLTITGNSLFNANTLIGFLILLGVVVNNGIILIDFVNVLRSNGYRRTRAILTAGMSRVRPIMITAITTCVALLPLALGKAEYVKAIGPPFAVTVIGGLSISTLLTLVFIPMLYNGIEQALKWLKELRLFVKLVMLLLEITGIIMVILFMDSFLWQIASVLLVVAGIPVAYWFVTSSLRKASKRIIGEDEPLHIHIANLVKIYGREGRAIRDYKTAKMLTNRVKEKSASAKAMAQNLIWQLPLLAFLVYFTWFYLVSGFWQLLATIAAYYYIILLLTGFKRVFNKKWFVFIVNLIMWLAPLFVLAVYHMRWQNLAVSLLTGFLWYLILMIRYVSNLLHQEGFSIKKIRKIFRWFVLFVNLLPIFGLRKDKFKALKGVSIDIGTGMFGLLGPNGAGKSTMIRIICGILDQSYGKIWINGIDTQEKREELQGLIGYLPQEFGMYENMSAWGYLEYQAMMKGLNDPGQRNKRVREVLESVHMWDHRHKKIGTYSGGMKQRIGIAQVLLHLPRILVVDEPTAGLDPRERIRFRNLLVELSRNRIVIFSTHIIEDISSSCNTMAVINRGQVLFTGSPRELTEIARGKVWKAVLPADEFEALTRDLLVINHMKDGQRIRVRCLSAKKPFKDAEEDTPLLEDAYLWMIRSDRVENHIHDKDENTE